MTAVPEADGCWVQEPPEPGACADRAVPARSVNVSQADTPWVPKRPPTESPPRARRPRDTGSHQALEEDSWAAKALVDQARGRPAQPALDDQEAGAQALRDNPVHQDLWVGAVELSSVKVRTAVVPSGA